MHGERGKAVAETARQLEMLLQEVRRAADRQGDAAEAVEQLLKTARDLIATAERLSSGKLSDLSIAKAESLALVEYWPARPSDSISDLGQWAKDVYRARRLRDQAFKDETLFGEPAWDILLDMLDAEAADKPVSVTSVCAASGVPPTTGLRYLTLLEKRGYVERSDDEADGRRKILRLTAQAHEKFRDYFKRVRTIR